VTTLLITNDFGPRIGGIESFNRSVCRFLDDDVVVLTAAQPGDAGWDAAQGFEVVRVPGPLLPTPRVRRLAQSLQIRHACRAVVFGAAAPLGLLAPALRPRATRIVALSHGHEVWWARVRPARALLRRIGDEVDVLTTISDHTTAAIEQALSSRARSRIVRLPPPVDTGLFAPRVAERDPRLCVAAGRFVPQKGFRMLLDAWDLVQRQLGPAYRLHLVGTGPEEGRLRRRAAGGRHPHSVTFLGAVRHEDLPARLQRAGVFALPVRSMLGGLYAEGLGLCFVEAASCGLPVVVGASGGAPETVLPGRSGFVVDPADPRAVADAVATLLTDPDTARRMGAVGRDHVGTRYSSRILRPRFRRILGLDQ
jgi:phosphatidylinositol alpha-1,6-mannosyltransferase